MDFLPTILKTSKNHYPPENDMEPPKLVVCRHFSFSKGGIFRFHVSYRGSRIKKERKKASFVGFFGSFSNLLCQGKSANLGEVQLK